MANLLPAIIATDDSDSDDSDYIDSGGSSESSDIDDIPQVDSNGRNKRDESIDREYVDMKAFRDTLYAPPKGAHRDLVWESFNRRSIGHRKDRSLGTLMGMLGKVCYVSKKATPEEIDINKFKKEARAEGLHQSTASHVMSVGDVLERVRKADKLEIDSHMKYAGQTVSVKRVVSSTSAEGRKHLRKAEIEEKNAFGVSLGSLDAYLRSLKAGQVTSVEKSSAEWSRFKASNELDDAFEKDRRDGYLHKRAFLEAADERGYEAKQAAEKRARRSDPSHNV
ncbi:hypothetical protein FOL47_004318 [Perkinsus chesapeaki]|uniref:BCNT-C domain-containing protein n=1 Tax=Perkinsus chesapeaki TaxID=330153 RepID=A0A7J6M3F2_PERCH|nr:hypothetical protein FOL47_004318 [Perkinsus chesapeaki]